MTMMHHNSHSYRRQHVPVLLIHHEDNNSRFRIDLQNYSLGNCRPFRIRASNHHTQSRRIHSTMASKSVWRGLHQAVRQGNGSLAEEIAEQVLQDYYRLAMSSSSPDTIDHGRNNNFYPRSNINQNMSYSDKAVYNSNENNLPLLDSHIFSLVLQAWKNSENASLHSALRAHNLLIQMAALADQDVLCDPPALEDYLAVLECWHQACSLDEDEFNKKKKQSTNITLVLRHVEELWSQMRERQRREMMTNQTPYFMIDERAYELFAALLAKAGRAAQTEQIVEEAVVQKLGRNVRRYNFPTSTVLKHEANDIISNKDKNDPQVGLNLCHIVLQAFLRSKETKAPERSEAFLQKMRTDPRLPKPDVNSYNLVLECLMVPSKSSQNIGEIIDVANRVESLIHQMKEEDRIQPNLVSYQYGIDALARSGDAISAETMLANLVKDYFLQYDADLKPTVVPFQSVLWAYSKAATNAQAHRRLVDAAERAESILNNMKELSTLLDTYPTVWSYNIVMKCWANSRSHHSVNRTLALFEELKQLQTLSDDNHKDEIMDDYHEKEGISAIHPPHDLKPDVTSINTVLNVLSINGSATRTEQKLWEFYDAHIQEPRTNPSPDTISFSTTINAWSKSLDPNASDRVDALLRKMIELYDCENKNIYKPDVVTYTSVMQCWIKSKKPEGPEKVESILRELQRKERDGDETMKPDAICWNSAISAWGVAGNGKRAEALFFEMVDGSTKFGEASPTSITLTNALKAWTQTKSSEASHRAIKLLARMEELYKDGVLSVKPNVVHYSVVLDCLAYARSSSAAQRAENMLHRMTTLNDPNLCPNVVSYNCVIKAWSYAQDQRSASKITFLLRNLIDRSEKNPKMRPNENTFGTILRFLADSNLPNKAKRARAIENLMNIFLEREPKQWIKKELKRCILSGETNSDISCDSSVDTFLGSLDERIDCNQEDDELRNNSITEKQTDNEEINKKNVSCRGKRANARFNNEIKMKRLVRKPLTGRPELDHGFESGDCSNNNFHLRDALVRVRMIDKITSDNSKHRTLDKIDVSIYAFSLIVVDGKSEYFCKVLDVDKNCSLEIKGGQFLDIFYYWHHGEPIIVKMQNAIEQAENHRDD